MSDDSPWTLAENGDSFEREWAAFVLDGFPAYERFWRRHVVPLSFRAREPDNGFIRPSLPPVLVALADTAYALFYHVAHAHAYKDRLFVRKDFRDFPRPTECLYCFFAHAHSSHEALLHVCRAVNRVLVAYGADEAFAIEMGHQDGRHPYRLRGGSAPDGTTVDLDGYDRLQSLLAAYRNLLVHEKPIFLQSQWLPRTRELDRYSGLTAIGHIVKDPDCINRDFRPAGDALVEVIALVKAVAQEVFEVATGRLDGLVGSTDYDRERRKPGADHRLTREHFLRTRNS